MRSSDRTRALLAMLASGVLAFAGTAAAQYSQNPPATTRTAPAATSAADAKPIIPSRAETSDAAFRKLDAGAKGYVSRGDVKDLSGFDQTFMQNDANRDGKLTSDEFQKAWTSYSGHM